MTADDPESPLTGPPECPGAPEAPVPRDAAAASAIGLDGKGALDARGGVDVIAFAGALDGSFPGVPLPAVSAPMVASEAMEGPRNV